MRRMPVFVLIGVMLFMAGQALAVIGPNTRISYGASPPSPVMPNAPYTQNPRGVGYTPVTEIDPVTGRPVIIGSSAASQGFIVAFGINIKSSTGQRLTRLSVRWIDESPTTLTRVEAMALVSRTGTILDAQPGGDVTHTINPGLILPTDAASPGPMYYLAFRLNDTARHGETLTFHFLCRAGDLVWVPTEAGDAANPVTDLYASYVVDLRVADYTPFLFDRMTSTGIPNYPAYSQWHPGEMIRPRYESGTYQYAPSGATHNCPQVMAWEEWVPVLAFSCSQRNFVATVTPAGQSIVVSPAVHLDYVTVSADGLGDPEFNPNEIFRIGDVRIYRDDGNGYWDPADTLVGSSQTPFVQTPTGTWAVLIQQTGLFEPIEDVDDGNYDYFIVVRVRSDSETPAYRGFTGWKYKLWIEPGDIQFALTADPGFALPPVGPHPVMFAGIPEIMTKVIYNTVYVEPLSQERFNPNDVDAVPDMTSDILPVLGIDAASGAGFSGIRLETIKLQCIAANNFDPRLHLAPLVNNDISSGVSLWRDNKGGTNVGSFDTTDTLVPFSVSPWVFEGPVPGGNLFSCTIITQGLVSDPGIIPPDDMYQDTTGALGPNRGSDFFIAVRTRPSLPYGSRFRFLIPANGITLTAPRASTARSTGTTPDIQGNVYAKVTPVVVGPLALGPSSPSTSVLRVDLNDNGSGMSPRLEGISVEFYDAGGFSLLTCIASFDPVAPTYSGGWFNVTNFSPDALKQCGLVIYRDASLTDPVLIKRFRRLAFSGGPDGYEVEFLNPVFLPSTLYVGIRTSATCPAGAAFNVGIVGWGLGDIAWNSWASRAFPISDALAVRTNIYARNQTGTFNPNVAGIVLVHDTPYQPQLNLSKSYDGIYLKWTNNSIISPAAFLRYEIHRSDDGGATFNIIDTIFDYSANSYANTRTGINPPVDGVTHRYFVRMYYQQGGSTLSVDSNTVTATIIGMPDVCMPSVDDPQESVSLISLNWKDNSQTQTDINHRASHFLLRRVRVSDGAYYESVITVNANPSVNVFYHWDDTSVETGVHYYYQILARRQLTPTVAIHSKPVTTREVWTFYQEPEGGGSGCFIATAAFGSPFGRHLDALRAFRDTRLSRTAFGKAFVAFYEKHSPRLARWIARRPVAKSLVRIALTPVVWLCDTLR